MSIPTEAYKFPTSPASASARTFFKCLCGSTSGLWNCSLLLACNPVLAPNYYMAELLCTYLGVNCKGSIGGALSSS